MDEQDSQRLRDFERFESEILASWIDCIGNGVVLPVEAETQSPAIGLTLQSRKRKFDEVESNKRKKKKKLSPGKRQRRNQKKYVKRKNAKVNPGRRRKENNQERMRKLTDSRHKKKTL